MGSDFYLQSILPHAGIIIKICRAYTHSQVDFEDYYQEVCLQIWRSKDNFKGQSAWSTWIYRISLNVCLTYLKKRDKDPQHFASDAFSSRESSREPNEHPEELLADAAVGMSDEINQLYTAIRQLSEIDRAVILLYLEEQSYQEIAEIIGTKANNIGVRITRIKDRLHKILETQGQV